MLVSYERECETLRRRILFLGAGRRYDLINLFLENQSSIGVELEFKSVEKFIGYRPPISDLIEVLNGPSFESEEFTDYLVDHLKHHHTSIIISCMELSTLRLSEIDWSLYGVSFWGTPNSKDYIDKLRLYNWAKHIGLSYPEFTGNTKIVVVKNRIGYGSREQIISSVENSELDSHLKNKNLIVQDFVEGPETSIDCYVTKNRAFSAIARDRLNVVGGEVMETKTRSLSRVESEIIRKIIENSELLGPINIQLIGRDNLLLDINPRFSGGATASIRAGWIAHEWLIKEYLLDRSISFPNKYESLLVTRSRRDHVRMM